MELGPPSNPPQLYLLALVAIGSIPKPCDFVFELESLLSKAEQFVDLEKLFEWSMMTPSEEP